MGQAGHVIHRVGLSWEEPGEFFRVNAEGTLHVLQAARRCDPSPTVLLISSAEVYGNVAPAQLPLQEDSPLRPVSPYAASKAAAELLGIQAHLGYGVRVIRARPFNHAGPGQAGHVIHRVGTSGDHRLLHSVGLGDVEAAPRRHHVVALLRQVGQQPCTDEPSSPGDEGPHAWTAATER